MIYREFDPSFQAVAKAWSKVSKEHRDQHFFGVVDYDDAPGIFNKVPFRLYLFCLETEVVISARNDICTGCADVPPCERTPSFSQSRGTPYDL